MTNLLTHLFAWGWCLVPITAAVLVLLVVRSNRRDKATSRDWWLARRQLWRKRRTQAIKRGDYSRATVCLERAGFCLDEAERR